MDVRIFQKGFNYSQDGPGNRLVYHMQGCNMRCPWCANPEGMNPSGGDAVAVSALLDEARRSKSMFFEGGGVTFTGGEPTLQFEALRALLTGLKAMGIDTALETNATHPRLPELFALTDHLMLDFKQPFADRHQQITGARADCVLQNLRAAASAHPDALVRVPMIGGFNDSDADQEAFADTLAGICGDGTPVEVLRYHEYGRDKWTKLGRPYAVANGFVSDERYHRFLSRLRGKGLRTVRT